MGSPFLFIPRTYTLLLYHMGGVAHLASHCYRWVGLRAFPDDLSGPGGPDEGRTDSPTSGFQRTGERKSTSSARASARACISFSLTNRYHLVRPSGCVFIIARFLLSKFLDEEALHCSSFLLHRYSTIASISVTLTRVRRKT